MLHPHPGSEVVTHVPDVVWLVGLWLAIHGGDPGPDATEVTQQQVTDAANSMITALKGGMALSAATTKVSADQLKKLGVTVYQQKSDAGSVKPFCLSHGGGLKTVCMPGGHNLK